MVCRYADEPEGTGDYRDQRSDAWEGWQDGRTSEAGCKGSCEQHELCDDDFDSDLQREQIKIYPAFTGWWPSADRCDRDGRQHCKEPDRDTGWTAQQWSTIEAEYASEYFAERNFTRADQSGSDRKTERTGRDSQWCDEQCHGCSSECDPAGWRHGDLHQWRDEYFQVSGA